MQILEDHNKQLESQLRRLRELLLQVLPEQGFGEACPWGGLCCNGAGAMAETDGWKWERTRTECHDNAFSLQPPAESDGNCSAVSSLVSSLHQSEGSQAKEKEHNTPDTEAAGEDWSWAELLALLSWFSGVGSYLCPAILKRCWLVRQIHREPAPPPPALFPAADEVEAKTQEVSMCLEDIMEKLRSAFPSSRGTRVKSPSLASYCSLR